MFLVQGGNSAVMQSENANGTFNTSSGVGFGTIGLMGMWIQLSDDGTTRKVNLSADGNHWATIVSESRTTFITPTKLLMGVFNAGVTVDSWG